MKVDLGAVGTELTSSRWLDALALTPTTLRQDARGTIEVDLSAITWISHLPLLAICLGLQEIANAKFDEQRVLLPENEKVRAFLERWHFNKLAARHNFLLGGPPLRNPYAETDLGSTVLEIHEFRSASDAADLRETFRRTGTNLRNLLVRGSFLNEHDIQGLADLIVYELCENAAEHAETTRPAMIFGHVSRDKDPTRSIYLRGASDWEKPFFTSIRGEGMTEIVIGDAGIGIIGSLREHAERQNITAEKDVLRWAFEPFSTSKRERAMHTRGLWAVKSKIRDLRGILYVRSGVTDRNELSGWSASWDFFNNTAVDAPVLTKDNVPFGGTQVQILLPHRMSRYTFIEYHRPLLARTVRELETREVLIPTEPSRLDLREQIATLADHTVLFVDMSQMSEERWQRSDIDEIGRQINEGLGQQHARIWLLNPDETIVQHLNASSWIVELWREQAILLPYVRIKANTPPHIGFVVKDAALRSTDRGDTAEARQRLTYVIGLLTGEGDKIRTEKLSDLTPDERSWIANALATNLSLVDPLRDEEGAFAAALDIEKLSRRALGSLLGQTLRSEIERKIKLQRDGPRVWYRLPSQVFCRDYIDPSIFGELKPLTRDLLEQWIEEKVRASRATHAISYTTFASEMLTRAKRAAPIQTLEPLRHYEPNHVREQLHEIPRGSHVVLLAAISGSGKTIADTVRMLRQRDIRTTVVTVIDTTTPAERQDVLAGLEKRGDFHYRTRWQIEKLRAVPAEDKHVPIAIVDPETLVPVIQVPELPTRIRDGRFWRLLSESEGVSVGSITYKGIDYTTMILLRNVLRHKEVMDFLVADFRTCFRNAPGSPLGPDIICCPRETMKVLGREHVRRLRKEFPEADFIPEDALERPRRGARRKKKIEGQHVVIFAAAATSGAGVARLRNHFQTAKRLHLSVFVNRISDGLMLALTGGGLRISLTTFQRLVSGSPELRLGSSRSIALPALNDYRASCVSNRLLLFVDKIRREVSEPRVAQSPDELESVATPEPPATLVFDNAAVYRFGTTEGLESLKRLVQQCLQPNAKWLYGILDEVASRAEASLRNLRRDSGEWQRTYLEDLARLYREAPHGEDITARRTILDALLLDRWRWSEARERTDAEKEADGATEIAVERDAVATAFARELLNDASPTTHPDLVATVIRSISKVDREVLIDSLGGHGGIIDVARLHRTTELTLALELTKILDDFNAAQRLIEKLTAVAQERARQRPPGRDEPFDVALDDLLADVGLHIVLSDGLPKVEFLPWPRIAEILATEPPDHDRTMRLLIRAMRGLFGPSARVLYYNRNTHTYGDAWPRRGPTDKSKIREANIRAISLLGSAESFFAPRLGGDPATEEFLSGLSRTEAEKLRKWGMALFRVRLPDREGLIRLWQNVELHGPLRSEHVDAMHEAVKDAERLITLPSSSVSVIGDWQYEQLISSLAESGEYDPVIHFAEVVRELLGGDVSSVLVLDDAEQEWSRVHLGGRGRALPLRFGANEPDRVTNTVARSGRGLIFRDVAAAASAGFKQRPAVDWAQAWLSLPLMREGAKECRAVLHIWHHIPGWFSYAEPLLYALQSLGGTVVELNAAYKTARIVRRAVTGGALLDIESTYLLPPLTSHTALQKPSEQDRVTDTLPRNRQFLVFDRDEIDRLSRRLINLTFAADGLMAAIISGQAAPNAIETLQGLIDQTRENLSQLFANLHDPEMQSVPLIFEKLIQSVIDAANRRYEEKVFQLNVHETIGPMFLHDRMMHRAIEELLKNARAHVPPGQQVRVDLTRDERYVILDVQNPGYGIPAERKEKIFGMGSGLLLAKAAAEKHGGQLEEIGPPGQAAVFRMTIPVPPS